MRPRNFTPYHPNLCSSHLFLRAVDERNFLAKVEAVKKQFFQSGLYKCRRDETLRSGFWVVHTLDLDQTVGLVSPHPHRLLVFVPTHLVPGFVLRFPR